MVSANISRWTCCLLDLMRLTRSSLLIAEVEALLTICDAVDPFLKVAPTGPDGARHGGQRGDSEDEDDEEASRRTRRGKIQRADLGSYGDDELDL